MLLSTATYGSTAVKYVRTRIDAPVLVVGKDRFTRGDLASAECFSYVAAHNITDLIKDLNVASLKELYNTVTPAQLAIPRLGPISLMVLGAAFELRKLGTIETWAAKHRAADALPLSFPTLKQHELAHARPRSRTH